VSAFWIQSKDVVLPGQEPAQAAFEVRDGKIGEIRAGKSAPAGADVHDFGAATILPGLVDTHAHINEPGRTEWEGFETATRAAAVGGITTVIDMPLNSIPATTSLESLRIKMREAAGKCRMDYGFWGGVVPGNASELEPMVRAGVFGFKCFLCPSGVDEFPHVSEKDLRIAMPILAKLGVPLLVHAELETPVELKPRRAQDYFGFLESRPASWEVDAIRLMIRLSRETGCRTHIVHLSAADATQDIREARASGVPMTAETCPHYLTFSAEKIAEGATHFKCCPPIREDANREKLWRGLQEGDIEFVVSDHSPCTPALKLRESGDFLKAWGGIAGLQFGLPVIWTEMKKRGLTLSDLSRLMSERTSAFLGLESKKGSLTTGADADFVVFDAETQDTLRQEQVLHRHPITPYAEMKVLGKVLRTYLRGQLIAAGGKPVGDEPLGTQLTPSMRKPL